MFCLYKIRCLLSGEDASLLVGVGDALLDTRLYERHVLLQMVRLPRLQQLVEELARVATYLLGARAHAAANRRQEASRMCVLKISNNKKQFQ